MVPKIGLDPAAWRGAPCPRTPTFTTLLMSTGLTFGTISSLYGLNAGIIDRRSSRLLVTVVVLSAILPTAIAQRWFSPDVEAERRRDLHPERRFRRRSTSRKPLAPGIEADQEASGLGRLLDHRRVARPGDDRHADPEFPAVGVGRLERR